MRIPSDQTVLLIVAASACVYLLIVLFGKETEYMSWQEAGINRQHNFDIGHALSHILSDSQLFVFNKNMARLACKGENFGDHFGHSKSAREVKL